MVNACLAETVDLFFKASLLCQSCSLMCGNFPSIDEIPVPYKTRTLVMVKDCILNKNFMSW